MSSPKRRWWLYLKQWARKQLHWAVVLASCLSWIAIDPLPAAASAVGLQEYLIFGNEKQIFDIFEDIYGPGQLGVPWMASVVTFVATSDHQMVCYDHWEDGYEADILHPVQASTEVYGDGVPLGDVLYAGDVISLNSDRNDTTIHGYVPIDPRDPGELRYDAGDRVASVGGPVDLIHAMWPREGTYIGDAFEVYARQAWISGDRFLIPMGIDTYLDNPTHFPDLQHVYLELSAFEEDTLVQIDNGVKTIDLVLHKGETFSSLGYIDTTSFTSTLQIDILAGTSVRSDKRLQAGLVTCGASSPKAQSRFLTLIPAAAWGREYISPIPRTTAQEETEVYIFNAHPYPISVEAHDLSGSGTFTIPAASAAAYRVAMGRYVPSGSGLRLRSDHEFWAVAAADTGSLTYDWGYNMVPAEYLAQEYYVSWAPGSADLVSPGVNGSPVWVTPLADHTIFYVDYSPVDGAVDETFELDALHTRRIFDPDRDNTGMHIWASDRFAAIWGEDADTAGAGTPYLDLGYTVLPLYPEWMVPLLTVEQTITPHILPAAGGTATFHLYASSRDAAIQSVDVTDTLPVQWSLVNGTAVVTWPDGSQANMEPQVTGQDLFWDMSALLDPGQTITIEFEASVSTGGSIGMRRVDNMGSVDYAGGTNWGAGSSWVEYGDLVSSTPWLDGAVRIVSGPPGYIEPYQGSYQLYLGSTVTGTRICRETDLSGFVRPTLRFKRALDNVAAGDAFYLDVYDGVVTHTGVLSWTAAHLQDTYAQNELDLRAWAGPDTRICFRAGGVLPYSEVLYLDSVEIYDALALSENTARATGTYQDLLLVAADRSPIQIGVLDLVKGVDRAVAAVGDTLVYTLTYSNNSGMALTDATVYDTLPPATTFAGSSAGGSYISATHNVVWTMPLVGISQTGVLTVAVSADRAGVTLENRAWMVCDQEGPVPSNLVETVILSPELLVEKSAPADVTGGGAITYLLAYENRGPLPASGAVISDLVPAPAVYLPGSLEIDTGMGWVSLSDGVDGDAGACSAGLVSVRPGALPGTVAPGEAGRVRFVVRVPEDMPGGNLVLNEALYQHAAAEPQYSNLTVTRIHELALDKRAAPATVTPSDLMTYTLVYSNYSMGSYSGVWIQDAVPQHTNYVPGSAAGADAIEYSWDGGVSWTGSEPITPVTDIRWHDADLPAGMAGVEVSFVVRVSAPLTEGIPIENTAYAGSASIPVVIQDTAAVVVHTPVLSVTKRIDGSGWWDTDWRHRVKLTLDNRDQAEDLVDFAVLVVLDDSRVNYAQVQDAGQDLRFVDADGATVLAHEIEQWDEAGRSYVWVRVPRIDGGSGSDAIWMYYGNEAAPDSQDPVTAWDGSYEGVWHLGQAGSGASGEYIDSSAHGRHGQGGAGSPSRVPLRAPGVAGYAQNMDGANDYIDTGYTDDLAEWTVEAWIWADSVPVNSGDEGVVHKVQNYMLSWSHQQLQHRGAMSVKTPPNNWDSARLDIGAPDVGRWVYVVGTYQAGSLRAYKDGLLVNENTDPDAPPLASIYSAKIGRHGEPVTVTDGAEYHFGGLIDEVRISSAVRSPAWIAAQFKNVRDEWVTFGQPAGAPISYTLTVANTGLGAASNVVVTDVLPVGAAYLGGGTLVGGSTISWLIPYLAAGESAEVILGVQSCQPSLRNAFYRVAGSDQGADSAHGPPLVTPLVQPTIGTGLAHVPLTVTTQSPVDFTAAITTDGGPIVAWAWQFGDGDSASGPAAGHVFPVAGTYTVTLTVTDTCGYTGTASAAIDVAEYAMNVSKSSTHAAPLVPGATITYSVAISNGGSLDAAGIELFDPLPAFTTLVAGSVVIDPPGAGLPGSAPPVLAADLTVPAGQSITVTYQVTVSPDMTVGATITNEVFIVDRQVGVTTTGTTSDRVTGVDLAVSKTGAPSPAVAGTAITYTLVVSNLGPGLVEGAAVSDPAVAGLSDVSWTCTPAGGAACTASGSGAIDDTIDLPGWGVVTYTLHATVEAWVSGTLTNTATVSVPAGLDELNPDDNIAQDARAVLAVADLRIDKTADPDPVGVSSRLTFTLSVSSTGPSVARSIVVTDVLAPGVFYAGASGAGWDCGAVGQVVTCTRDSLAVGVQSDVLLAVTSPLTSSLLINTAAVGAATIDPDEANNQAAVTITVGAGPLADLSVTKVVDHPAPHEQEVLVYTLTVTNHGPAGATGVRLVDSLPAGLAYQGHASGQGSYDDLSGLWQVGALGAGSSATLLITATVDAGMAGLTITNTAHSLGADQADPDPANNEDQASVTVRHRPVLVVGKAGPAEASVGERVVFTLTVTHDGLAGDGSAVAGVTAVDDAAGPAVYVSGDDGDGRLELGESWVLTASYTILLTDTTPLVSTVSVAGVDMDGDPVTAQAMHTMTVHYNPRIHITKLGPAVAYLGDVVRYTFIVANTSFVPTWVPQAGAGDGSPITDLVVTDSIAGPAVFVSGDKNGNGMLDLGETWLYEAFYVVQPADPDPLLNTATVTGRDGEGDLLTGSDSHSLDIEYVPALQPLVTGPASVVVGDTIEWFCSIAHAAPSDGSPVHSVVVSNSQGLAVMGIGGDSNANNQLDPGETWVYRTTRVVQPSDPSPLVNQCTVTAQDADGDTVSGSSGHSVIVESEPDLILYLPLVFKSRP